MIDWPVLAVLGFAGWGLYMLAVVGDKELLQKPIKIAESLDLALREK